MTSARDTFTVKLHQLSRAGGPAWSQLVDALDAYSRELIELAVQRDPPSPLHNGKAAMLVELRDDFRQIDTLYAKLSTKR